MESPNALAMDRVEPAMSLAPVWLPVLHNPRALSAYMATLATDDFDAEYVEELFHNTHAKLAWVDIAELKQGPQDNNARSATKARSYAKLSSATRPPIVVDDGIVRDGNHRFRDAIKKGETQILAYVVADGEIELAPHFPKQR